MHPAALPLDALLPQCDITRTRRGGPGGQHRNKVETAVVITHRPSGVSGQASERRSQDLNRQMAIQRLRVRFALAVRLPVEANEPPSDLWQSRSRGRQMAVNAEHSDFPALLAEALDRLSAGEWNATAAAERLGVTPSQLVKFLKLEPAAFQLFNSARETHGLKALR